mmetsp:Transcript_15757/g.35871  ORF Transcript_15757/g.35871 Transcript_15757/m.35871 type:complete len:223 (+) Transcript_15757:56-724(+)
MRNGAPFRPSSTDRPPGRQAGSSVGQVWPKSVEEGGDELEDLQLWEAHDAVHGAVDAGDVRGDEVVLDHEPAGAPEDLALGDEGVDGGGGNRGEVDVGAVDLLSDLAAGQLRHRDAPHRRAGRARVPFDEAPRLRRVLRLLQDLSLVHHHLVARDQQRVLVLLLLRRRHLALDGVGLGLREDGHELRRILPPNSFLVDVRGEHVVLEAHLLAQLVHQLPPHF